MKKSLLLTFGAIAVFGLVSCGTPPEDLFSSSGATSQSETEMQSIYRLYRQNGGNLTYEEWIESIRGEKGEKGDPGKDGANFLSGVGTPELALGKDGDTYLDIQAWAFYKKSNGVWQRQGIPGQSSSPGTVSDEDVIEIWVEDLAAGIIRDSANSFISEYNRTLSGRTFNINVRAIGTGDTAAKKAINPYEGADIFFFNNDQVKRLASLGALTNITDSYKSQIENNNADIAVSAGKVGDKQYAFPVSIESGYFLYYDKAKFSADDVKSWEAIIAKAEAGQYEVDFQYSSAWYNFGFFYGAGADSVWTIDSKGIFVDYEDTYDSDKGIAAAKGLAKVASSEMVIDNSSIRYGGAKMAAIVDGTWDYEDAKTLWGDNLACAPLPTFTVDNVTYKTGSFSNSKLLGIKPQNDAVKAKAALSMANYLTGEASQKKYFESFGWTPSNKNVQDSAAVKAAPQVVALLEQSKSSKIQGLFPNDWWTAAGAIGITFADLGNPTDAQIRATVKTYKDQLPTMLG